jgi:hypothetical protein
MILRDINFPVRTATITGYILHPEYVKDENPRLEWEVSVQTEERMIDEEYFASPRISWGEFGFEMRRWSELEGKTIHFDAARDDLTVPHAFSYFDTHELIPYSTLKFGKREGNKFVIDWEGTCDPRLGEPYQTNVPFRIRTEAVFKKVSVMANHSDTDATTLERLSKYLDPADFIQHPLEEPAPDIPVEKRFGIFDPLLRWAFRRPAHSRLKYRYSIFKPRVEHAINNLKSNSF